MFNKNFLKLYIGILIISIVIPIALLLFLSLRSGSYELLLFVSGATMFFILIAALSGLLSAIVFRKLYQHQSNSLRYKGINLLFILPTLFAGFTVLPLLKFIFIFFVWFFLFKKSS